MNALKSAPSRLIAFLTGLSLAVLIAPRLADSQTPPAIHVRMSNGLARLSVTGATGSVCTIQSATDLSLSWEFMTNFTVLSNPVLMVDTAVPTFKRYYRVYSQIPPTNSAMSRMVWIPPGTFTMGSPDTEADRAYWEGPQTQVTISHGFWMGKYHVTQAEYCSVMANNPSHFVATNGYGTDLSRPVEIVSWYDAVAYCSALTMRERNAGWLPSGYEYRLPTDAEWEYACRAGTTTAFYFGPALRSGMVNFSGYSEYDASVGTIDNPNGIALSHTTPVGSYAPNAFGLYDMCGNVWDWCQDWFSTSLPGGSVTDPQGPDDGSLVVIRGGSWASAGRVCRSAYRYAKYQDELYFGVGFRVILAAVP